MVLSRGDVDRITRLQPDGVVDDFLQTLRREEVDTERVTRADMQSWAQIVSEPRVENLRQYAEGEQLEEREAYRFVAVSRMSQER